MTLTLPYPPTANLYWRHVGHRVLLSKEAREFKTAVAFIALRIGLRQSHAFCGEVIVNIDLFRPQRSGDLDNYLKVTLDSLKGIAFHDDRQIVEIHARRFEDKANPRVEVRIEETTDDLAPLVFGAEKGAML